MIEANYSNFYTWIAEDDIVSSIPQIVEGNNVTGLNTGYGITLWPKVTNQLLTNGNAPRAIFGRERTDLSLEDIAVWCDTWEIYKLTSTDNTPIYTLTTWWNIVNGIYDWLGTPYMYFISKQPWTSSVSAAVMQVTFADFDNESFTSVNESFLNFNNIYTPPVISSGSFHYVWGLNTVYRIDGSWTIVTQSIFNRYVVWITKHGTRFFVYTDSWEVAVWDWVSSSLSASYDLWFFPARVTADGWIDHVISSVWDKYKVAWYEVALQNRKKQSDRLEDNSQFIKKLDFTPEFTTGQSIIPERWGVFIISSDTKPGIYRQDSLIEGIWESFHKSIARDNAWVDFDEIFTLFKLSKGQSKLFFGYQSWTTTYWVDYVDLESKETCKDGYFVTQILRWPPNKVMKSVQRRLTTYNVWWDNWIKLYVRIDNWSWELIRNTDDTNNLATIFRDKITGPTSGKRMIDLQMKVELHNETQSSQAPTVQGLSEFYSIIEDQ